MMYICICIYDVYMMYDDPHVFFQLETSKVSGEEAVAIYTTTVSWQSVAASFSFGGVEVSPKVLEDEF